jgi:hypothetical protein
MQTRNRQTQMQNRQGEQQGQTYYSYSYGYGYYDPFTGDWIEEVYGPFTGVGPLNYQRSDDRIEEDVCDRLAQHGQLDASNVDVSVNNGEVTLKGEVPDRRMKRLAEDIAFNVPGVFDVQNQLRINKHLSQGFQGQLGQGQSFKSQLKTGFEVDDSNGKKLGTVKEIHDFDFLIDRTMAPDLHVPFSAIQNINNNKVLLNLTSDQIDKMHWATSAKQTVGAR